MGLEFGDWYYNNVNFMILIIVLCLYKMFTIGSI